MIRAPDFWRDDGWTSRLLAPLGAAYGALAQARMTGAAPRAGLPTIVVGGLTTGGDGKTPLAIALAERLKALGQRPALLTRGYGRRSAQQAPLLVDPEHHDAGEVGDEALLLARVAPTIVGADRLAGATLAQDLGCTIAVLDDGFHSARLKPDLTLLAIDAAYGAGNGRCLPAGPLRAPLAVQFAAADMLVLIGGGRRGRECAAASGKPILTAHMTPQDESLSGARVVAFAGIARPEKFFETLSQMGAQIVETRAFADHHPFSQPELEALQALGRHHAARLATTEKDAARLGASVIQKLEITPLPTRLAFDDAAELDAALSRAF